MARNHQPLTISRPAVFRHRENGNFFIPLTVITILCGAAIAAAMVWLVGGLPLIIPALRAM